MVAENKKRFRGRYVKVHRRWDLSATSEYSGNSYDQAVKFLGPLRSYAEKFRITILLLTFFNIIYSDISLLLVISPWLISRELKFPPFPRNDAINQGNTSLSQVGKDFPASRWTRSFFYDERSHAKKNQLAYRDMKNHTGYCVSYLQVQYYRLKKTNR